MIRLKRKGEGLKKWGRWLNGFPGRRNYGKICQIKLMLMDFHPVRDIFFALLAGVMGVAARG
jgi:hypothetical protein